MKKFLFTLFALQFIILPSLTTYASGNLPSSLPADKKANLQALPQDSGKNSPQTSTIIVGPGLSQGAAPGATSDKKTSIPSQANDKAYIPEDEPVSAVEVKTAKKEAQYQEVIKQYTLYIASVPEDVRNEIRDFRKEVAKIQKMKRDLCSYVG